MTMDSKKDETVSSFLGDKLTTLPCMQGTSEISTVEECSDIANANAH